MGFFDDLNDVLGKMFNPPKPNNIGGNGYTSGAQGGGYGSDNRGLGQPIRPPESPYSQSYEQISSINQVSETPFKVVDINPYVIRAADFPCIYNVNTIRDLVGVENDFEYNAAAGGIPIFVDEKNANPYWRTVPIQANGNFLKIEFLPFRIQDTDTLTFSANNRSANVDNTNLSWDASTPSLPNVDYWTTPGSNQFPDASTAQQHQSKKLILVSFDSQQAIPILVEPGTVIKVPFNTVYVTFKTGNPRIRITYGYNTEIISPSTDRVANSLLHSGGGQGFLDKPLLHYSPFCVGHNDGDTSGVPISINAGAAAERIVVASFTTSAQAFYAKKGVVVFWLTGLEFGVNSTVDNTKFRTNWTLFISDTSGTLRRIVYRTYLRREQPGAARPNEGIFQIYDFQNPIRVCLHENEEMGIRLYNDSDQISLFSYSIRGYGYGRWRFDGADKSTTQIPIRFMDMLTEHPYFLDNQRTLAEDGEAALVVK